MSNAGSTNVGQHATSDNHWMLSIQKILWGIQGGWYNGFLYCQIALGLQINAVEKERRIKRAFPQFFKLQLEESSLSASLPHNYVNAGRKLFCCKAFNVLSHVFVRLKKTFPDALSIYRPVVLLKSWLLYVEDLLSQDLTFSAPSTRQN